MKEFFKKYSGVITVIGFVGFVAAFVFTLEVYSYIEEQRPPLETRGTVGYPLNLDTAPGSLVMFDNRIDGPLADKRIFGIVCGSLNGTVTIALIGTSEDNTCATGPSMTPKRWRSTYPVSGVYPPHDMPIDAVRVFTPDDLYKPALIRNMLWVAGVGELQEAVQEPEAAR